MKLDQGLPDDVTSADEGDSFQFTFVDVHRRFDWRRIALPGFALQTTIRRGPDVAHRRLCCPGRDYRWPPNSPVAAASDPTAL